MRFHPPTCLRALISCQRNSTSIICWMRPLLLMTLFMMHLWRDIIKLARQIILNGYSCSPINDTAALGDARRTEAKKGNNPPKRNIHKTSLINIYMNVLITQFRWELASMNSSLTRTQIWPTPHFCTKKCHSHTHTHTRLKIRCFINSKCGYKFYFMRKLRLIFARWWRVMLRVSTALEWIGPYSKYLL